MFDDLNEQLNQGEELDTETPTLRTAAKEVFDGLIHFTTAKGKLRSRPLSWAKRVAREHFGWSRIGSKKFEQILEIGFQESWFEKTDQGKLVAIPRSTVSDGVDAQTNNPDTAPNTAPNTSRPKSKHVDMAPFYRQGGAMGNWRVLTEDDWDGHTYSLITKSACSWFAEDTVIQVPSWKYGQALYELYDQKVREDLANGAQMTHCTSCKSKLPAECVYPDSHGRIACSACNDLTHPSLERGADWVPPEYTPTGIKPVSKPAKIPKTESRSVSEIKAPNSAPKKNKLTKLGRSIREDGQADLMNAEKAIQSAT